MELVNEGLPTENFRKVDTTFRTETTYKKDLMSALPLTRNVLSLAEKEYNGKIGHTLGRIHHIFIMSRIGIYYTV